jgi:hypothetical protein
VSMPWGASAHFFSRPLKEFLVSSHATSIVSITSIEAFLIFFFFSYVHRVH